MSGAFALKEPGLASYRTKAQKLMEEFAEVELSHIGRSSNQHADSLATLASKLKFEGEEVQVRVLKRTLPNTWFEEQSRKIGEEP